MTRTLLNRRAATYAMRLVPLGAYGRVFGRGAIGLCYHMVSAAALPHVAPLYPYKSPACFAADLRWLKRRFHLVSYRELQEAADAGVPAHPSWVHLTFDDGYAECYHAARPLLLEHGVPATFFLATEALDNRRALAFNRAALCLAALRGAGEGAVRRALGAAGDTAGRPLASVAELSAWLRDAVRDPDSSGEEALDRLLAVLGVDEAAFLASAPYLTGEQVREMAGEGFAFGGHTRLHWQLGRTAGAERVEREVVESCRVAAALSGAARVPFAFPYDAAGVDRAFLADLLARHPQVGLLFGAGGMAPDAPFIVNRFLVDAPPALGRPGSNLGGLFRGAWLEELLRLRREGPPPAEVTA